MNETSDVIFKFLLGETVACLLAVIFRDDKRKILLVLMVGTFVSGAVAYFPVWQSSTPEDSRASTPTTKPYIPATDIPTSAPSREQRGVLNWSLQDTAGQIVESAETIVYEDNIEMDEFWNDYFNKMGYSFRIALNDSLYLETVILQGNVAPTWIPDTPDGFGLWISDNSDLFGFNFFTLQSEDQAINENGEIVSFNAEYVLEASGAGISFIRCETDVQLFAFIPDAEGNVDDFDNPDWTVTLYKDSYVQWH